jgi:hypothetical protein
LAEEYAADLHRPEAVGTLTAEIAKKDKLNLDIFWIRDKSPYSGSEIRA